MKQRLSILLVLITAALALVIPAQALAAVPPNDDFDNATVLSTLPFLETLDTSEATTSSDDPGYACGFGQEATVWYAFAPSTDTRVDFSTVGSSYATTISVFTGTRGSLSAFACGFSQLSVTLSGGETYSIMVAASTGPYPGPGNTGGTLIFSAQTPPPPPNDLFANATQITGTPFSQNVDLSSASSEANEPAPSCNDTANRTAWFAFTPATSGSYSANMSSNNYLIGSVLVVYSGTTLAGLHEIACRTLLFEPLTVHMDAGTTYYYQLALGGPGTSTFSFDVAPAPQTSIWYEPFDPSIFDVVHFSDYSYDPAGIGIQSRAWTFGDGASSTESNPSHSYAKDGDYTVQLTVTTFDGRTATSSVLLHVKTHDVAITKFSAPQAASAGQTRQIVVGLSSKRYAENVRVELFKSVANGFVSVGTLTMTVPIRPSNRTTDFNFSYTFTSDDAAIGKVTFKAVATIVEAHDALPADNEAIASPTKVSKK